VNASEHLRILEVALAPGEEWTDANHEWRFLRVASGAAYWLEKPRPRSVAEREMLVLAPAAAAILRASRLNQVVFHHFSFEPEMLLGFFSLAERRSLEKRSAAEPDSVQFLPSTHPTTRHFAELVARCGARPALTERAEVLCLVTSFFSNSPESHPPPAATQAATQSRFEQIIPPMPDLELIQYTPDQLARFCACTPRHFHRLFRQRFGQSPQARIIELRLLRAKQLLKETDENMEQIASLSGYRSLSSFNACFKRRFAVGPAAWRNQFTTDPPVSQPASSQDRPESQGAAAGTVQDAS
jgi:AraC-like DNA-binding protein